MKKTTKAKKDAATEQELLELGKQLRDFYEIGYWNKKQALWFSFLKGVMGGLGAVVGTTFVLTLLLGILSILTDVPILGRLFDILKSSLSGTQ